MDSAVSRDESPSAVHREALERIPDGVVALDSEFRYTYDAAAAVLDLDPAAVLDTDCFATLCDEATRGGVRRGTRTGLSAGHPEHAGEPVTASGD